MHKLTKAQRKKYASRKKQRLKIKVRLTKALWVKGYRYRKNNNLIFGKPDLTFKKYKIAMFVDS